MKARKPKPNNHHKVSEDQDTPLEVITLSLPNHPTHQEHAQDHTHHIPLREDHRKGVINNLLLRDEVPIDSAEQYQAGNLEEYNLQRVGGADFHRQSDVAVHGEGDGVEEFGRVRDKGEECDAEELLGDVD
jgi:hypothetical protein